MDIQNFLLNLFPKLSSWFLTHGVKIILTLIVSMIFLRIGKRFIEGLIRKMIKADMEGGDEKAEKRREDTLISVLNGILSVLISVVAIFIILPEFGVDITPILAGAGLIGLAIGMAAKDIISDFIAGLFIILENQYRVGDVVCLDDVCGSVEDISLRKTVLRDSSGNQYHISNGKIGKVSNKSKGFSRIDLKISVAYKENLDRVIKLLNQIGEEMKQEEEWKDILLEAPKVLGVDDLSDSAVIIRFRGDTKPLEQWGSSREIRKRIKDTFDKENIEIPFPQISVWSRK